MRKFWTRYADPVLVGRYWRWSLLGLDWHCADCIATRWDQSHQHNRFCVSCHSMQPVYEEYKQSVLSRTPPACELNAMTVISRRISRHGEAQTGSEQRYLPDLYCHSIDTPEKFEAKRAELAERDGRE